MLCAAYPNGQAPYRHTHINHPMSKWVRSTKGNFDWVLTHALALCGEYTRRYQKTHKTQAVLEWIKMNPPSIPSGDFNDPPQCFGDFTSCKSEDFVSSYRKYYQIAKKDIARWAHSEKPSWFEKS